MTVLLDSPCSMPPFILRKLKVKALLKPVSGSRSNYNFALKLIVTMFQFQPTKSKKQKKGGGDLKGGWLWALFMEKDVGLSLAQGADGVAVERKASWITNILLRTCLPKCRQKWWFSGHSGRWPASRVLTLWSIMVKQRPLFLPNLCVIWGKVFKFSGLEFSHF